jgi:hypothetical protein
VAGRFPETAEGLSAGAVKSGIEGSLRRLGTDRWTTPTTSTEYDDGKRSA